MTSARRWVLGSGAGLVVAAVIGCGAKSESALVGSDMPGGGGFVGGDGGPTSPLDAFIEEGNVSVKIVTVACAGDCADVVTVASGGHPPYTFQWEDGSTSAARRVCPTSTTNYAVTVSDTGTTGELARPAETVRVPLTGEALECPDGGGASDAGAPVVCPSSPPSIDPPTIEVNANGGTTYVGGGASLPPGHYRAQWVGGCMRWSPGGPAFGWDVNDPPPGVFAGPVTSPPQYAGYCLLVDGSGAFVAALPGLTGTSADSGANDYASCVAAAPSTPPIEFAFAGGKLGVLANDLEPYDNTTGESAGGVSPTWRITFLSCP